MKPLTLALTIFLCSPLFALPSRVDVELEYHNAVHFAEILLSKEACDEAFHEMYPGRKKKAMLDYLDQMHIVVVDIPDDAKGVGTAGATIPPLAPRIIALDDFWLAMRPPLDNGLTIVHELVHLLDWSWLPEPVWYAMSESEREIRAELVTEKCRVAFHEVPEMPSSGE